jgi:hypothetical protein
MTAGRVALESLPAATKAARDLRYLLPDDFSDLTADELGQVFQGLTALRYSLNESIANITRLIASRPEKDPPCSSSDQPDTSPSPASMSPTRFGSDPCLPR